MPISLIWYRQFILNSRGIEMKTVSDALKRILNNASPAAQLFKLGDKIQNALNAGKPFLVSGTLIRTNTAGVTLIDASLLESDESIYITHIIIKNTGATAWTDSTATKVLVQDTNSSPVVVIDVAKAAITNAAVITMDTANVTKGAGLAGLTAGKGLVAKPDASFAAGTDLLITVMGYIK